MINQILLSIVSLSFAFQFSAFAGAPGDLIQKLRPGSKLRFLKDQGLKNTTGKSTYWPELFNIYKGKILNEKATSLIINEKATNLEGPQCYFIVLDDPERDYSASQQMVVTSVQFVYRSEEEQDASFGESTEIRINLSGGPLNISCFRYDSKVRKPQTITYEEFLETVRGVIEVKPACQEVKGVVDLDLSKNPDVASLSGASLLFNSEITLQTNPVLDIGIYTSTKQTSSAVFQNGLSIGNSLVDSSKPQCTFMSMSNRASIRAGTRLTFGRRDISRITPGHYAVLLSSDLWLSCDFSNANWGAKDVAETIGSTVSFQDVVCK